MTNPTTSGALRSEAFMDRAVAEHGDAVFRLALNQLRNTADAQDAVQETFVRLLISESRFENETHLRAWLLRVAINICHDMHRSAWHRRVEGLDDGPGALGIEALSSDSAEQDALRNLRDHPVWDALASLSDDKRLLIHLAYVEGNSAAEIARLLGINAATVRTRLFRARTRLRDVLSPSGADAAPDGPDSSPSTIRGEILPHGPPNSETRPNT